MNLEGYKDELLNHFSNAVKQIQLEHMTKEEENEGCISNDSPAGRILCMSLDMIFLHGLKHKEYGCWEAVRYFCRTDLIQQIEKLKNIRTNIGRGRAWIFLALNEKELEGFLQSFQMDLNHILKYYHKFALLCSSQVSVMQTLISGLDYVTFKLNPDLKHLDLKIIGHKSTSKSWTATNYVPKNKSIRGSSVHIDTSAVTDMATKTSQKAVGFVRGLLSHEDSSEHKSITNKSALVAVNSAPFRPAMKRCPDCKTSSELICLCVKENSQSQKTLVPSSNAELLDSIFNSGNKIAQASQVPSLTFNSQQRFNPFDKLGAENSDERLAESSIKRFNQEVAIVDAPIEVIRKKKDRRRNRFSDSGSDISTKSEDVYVHLSQRKNSLHLHRDVGKRHGSTGDISLSNPLIGFDPSVVEHEESYPPFENSQNEQSSHISTENITCQSQSIETKYKSVNESDLGVISGNEGANNFAISEMCNKTELTQTFVSNQHAYVSSQVRLNTTSDRVSSNSETKSEINLLSQNSASVIGNLPDNGYTDTGELAVGFTMTSMTETNLAQTLPDSSDVSESEIVKNSSVDSNANSLGDPEKLNQTSTSYEKCQSSSEEAVANGGEDESLFAENLSNNASNSVENCKQDNDSDPPISTEVAVNHDVSLIKNTADLENNNSEKLSVSFGAGGDRSTGAKKRTMRRYRSESEHLLNALTKKEVERLRAEIQNKLKPSQDRLDKVRKSIADKKSFRVGVGSFQHDSSFMLDGDRDSEASSSSRPLFDDLSDDARSTLSADTDTQAEDDNTSRTGDSSSLFSESASSLPATWRTVVKSANKKVPNSNIITESDIPHPAVANIDNTLRLYLMLEILTDENEAIIKLFHLSTGHAEGNWTPLYLLFSDAFVYFLRSGDGSCPYQPEEVVSYEDLDYIAVGSNSQTMQFVFYKNKSRPSKSSKIARGKVRTKLTIDTADKKLTDLIISNLSRALVSFTRQHSVTKVCPPIFHDTKEHQISLRKYMVAEGLTGDIQLYQLVHWEDPNFVTGANMSKISLEGTLRYRAYTFWGSTWRSAYFVLNGGILYQYQNKDSEKPDMSFELTRNNCVGCKRLRSTSSKTPNLQFELVFADDAKLELCGYSDIEVTEWLQCLCMIVSLDQASSIDNASPPDGIVMNMLHHDALVPCSLIVVDEQLLLCHEDQHTGFCRTLAKTSANNITAINVDKKLSIVCEIVIMIPSERPQKLNWGIFFTCTEALEEFLATVNSFSKAPTLNEVVGEESSMTHYREARTLLDNRWTRTDNLLRGRGGSVENYTFV